MRALILFFFYLFMVVGCSTTPENNSQKIYWPSAPSLPRVVYETTLRDATSIQRADMESEIQSFAVNKVAGSETQWLIKPYDIAAQQGLIVVSDTLLSAVHIFDVPRNKLFNIGWRGDARLAKPLGVALDEQLNVYVADAGLQRVVKFDKLGHFLEYIGKPEDFSRIADVAVSPKNGNVFVLDRGGVESNKHRFQIYSPSGDLLKTVGERGSEPGMFNHPVQLDIDQEGNIYVLDSGNFRISVFDSNGTFVRQWGKLGKNLGNMARPRGLAVNKQGMVFVTDAAFQNYQIFDNEGRLLLNIGEGGGPDLPGRYLLPAGIAVDETNRIYVVDQLRQKIEVFRLLKSVEIEALQQAR